MKELDVTSNCITSLKGIEKCRSLEKIIAHKNCLTNFEGLSDIEGTSLITYLDLSKNKLSSYEGLRNLKRLSKLKELYLEKKSGSNPLCKNKEKYYK